MGFDFCNESERQNIVLLFHTQRDIEIKPLYTYLCPVIIFICFLSILFNAILMSISRKSKFVNKSPILLLSLNLALTDLIASLLNGAGILFNSYLPEVYDIKMGQCTMLMFEVVRCAALVASALHLLALAFVHYRGIVKPLHYRSTIFFSQHLSRTINIISIGCWIIPLTIMIGWFSATPCQGFQSAECDYLFLLGFTFRYMVLTVFALPLLLMSVIYVRIFLIISRHQRGRRQNQERSMLLRGVISASGQIASAVNLSELVSQQRLQSNSIRCAACLAAQRARAHAAGGGNPLQTTRPNDAELSCSSATLASNSSASSSADEAAGRSSCATPPTGSTLDTDGGAASENKRADSPATRRRPPPRHAQPADNCDTSAARRHVAPTCRQKAADKALAAAHLAAAQTPTCGGGLEQTTVSISAETGGGAAAACAKRPQSEQPKEQQSDGRAPRERRRRTCSSKSHRTRNGNERLRAKSSLDTRAPTRWRPAAAEAAPPAAGAACTCDNKLSGGSEAAAPADSGADATPPPPRHKLSRANTIELNIQRATRWCRSPRPNARRFARPQPPPQPQPPATSALRSSISSVIATSSSLKLTRNDNNNNGGGGGRGAKGQPPDAVAACARPDSVSAAPLPPPPPPTTSLLAAPRRIALARNSSENSVAGGGNGNASGSFLSRQFPTRANSSATNCSAPPYEPQRRHLHAAALPQTNTKALVTTLLILGTYFISYVPAIIYQVLTCVDHCPYPLYDIPFGRRVLFGAMTTLLLIAKSIIDPLIYSYRMNEIQLAISRYLSKRRSKSSSQVVVTAAAAAAAATGSGACASMHSASQRAGQRRRLLRRDESAASSVKMLNRTQQTFQQSAPREEDTQREQLVATKLCEHGQQLIKTAPAEPAPGPESETRQTELGGLISEIGSRVGPRKLASGRGDKEEEQEGGKAAGGQAEPAAQTSCPNANKPNGTVCASELAATTCPSAEHQKQTIC